MDSQSEAVLTGISRLYAEKELHLQEYAAMGAAIGGMLAAGQVEPVGAVLTAKAKKIAVIDAVDAELTLSFACLYRLTGTATRADALAGDSPAATAARTAQAGAAAVLAGLPAVEEQNRLAIARLQQDLAGEIREMQVAGFAARIYGQAVGADTGVFCDRRE